MKCNIVFSRLKRFKFEKIKTNELRPDYGQICRTQWLKTQFAFACQKEPKLPDAFAWKTKYSGYQKQAVNYLEPLSRKNPQIFKNYLCVLLWLCQFQSKTRRHFSTCAMTPNSLKLGQRKHFMVVLNMYQNQLGVFFQWFLRGRWKKLYLNKNIRKK